MTHKALIDIYASMLKRNRALICEKDESYYPPLYKISICYSEVKNMVHKGVMLFKDAEAIKDKIIRTWSFRSVDDIWLSYEKPEVLGWKIKEEVGIGYINPRAIPVIKSIKS